jgi:predicted nuclease of predicted toxin-antitoxin system
LSRIFVDENVPKSVNEWLKKKGYDVVNVFETNLKGAKDHAIAEYASKRNLTILTLDTDFARIYHRLMKGTFSVIVVRANPATPSNIIEILNLAQPKIKIDEIKGKLVIISKKKIRIIA